jgi:PTH1 family peptidyl-tRNA hydrolase
MGLLPFLKDLLFGKTRPDTPEFMFFGLGNIGSRYAQTRHNIGFRVADELASRLTGKKNGMFGHAEYIAGTFFNSTSVIVAKPHTLMNRSGAAVASYVNTLNVPVSNTLVIVDDYHLTIGSMRARRSGSDGGHNGLASIIAACGNGFPRLRIGIGPLPAGNPSIEFVLGTFSEREEVMLRDVIPRAVEACLCFAEQGIDTLMNRYN